MKKVSVVLQDKDIAAALTALADAGVLHLEHSTVPAGEELDALAARQTRLRHVLDALDRSGPAPEQEHCGDVEQLALGLETALHGIKAREQQLRDLQAQIAKWEPWGAFDLYEVQLLKDQGLHVHLLSLTEAQLEGLPADAMIERISEEDGLVRVVVCSKTAALPGFEGANLPEYSLRKLEDLQAQALEEGENLEARVRDAARHVEALRRHLVRLGNRIARQRALTGRLVQDRLAVIRGYCPADAAPLLEQLAARRRWAWLIEEPADDDPVPTLLRNPKWVDLVKPVFGVINLLPGYRELDISPVFLVFFSIFFGMLIGDAGYGLVICLLTLAAHVRYGARLRDKSPFHLLYLLSTVTIGWGLLTGTVLGQQLFPGIRPLVPWLTDHANIQRLCFLIGVVHLSIAHLWRGLLKWPSPALLAEAGWLCLLWGMYFMALLLVLGDPMPGTVKPLFIAGPVLVVLFTRPSRNLLKALGSGLGSLAMDAVKTFTDIVSYIRLFAVGLATIAVADTFNGMALALGFDNLLTGFLAALILVTGHVFNMLLGAMAILVHGVRLNVLEFSGHMDLQWAGIPYEPFRNLKSDRT